ncbi:MAG: alpha-mannosidase [Tessaracoccus sp.]|uniref:alpha-mannosidase n=1 Tax=Tessaracoccus sp. TaxID=1971211 RepID=UPI001EC0E4E5|nr:glycoside hydrolase family 38 C-terminal domain-containing protein [Tessaracoccus sp.]MBK7820809.1 alpha-mannosidase [Tessaracoccus sp.]
MHDDRVLVEERIARLRERVSQRLYTVVTRLDVSAWRAPGEPVAFEEALAGSYADFPPGTWWGPAWSTWWLRVEGRVPAHALREKLDLRVDLGFVGDWAGNQSEGMVFTDDGWPLKAVNPMNRTVALNHGALAARAERASRPLLADEGTLRLYVEAAANPNMSTHTMEPTLQGDTRTASTDPVWRFGGADVVIRNDETWALLCDLEVLDGLMRELPEQSTHRARLLRSLEDAADVVDAGDIVARAAAARQVLAPLIASGANSSAQRMTAVGHAHIDSAWLWPIRETRRKVLRTFANTAALAEEYPDFHFACTSAQHYQWLKEASPEVFDRVREAIAAGQWHVVGGMWVESDTNLPGGESLVRQLTSGLRWMGEELGARPDCLWLPDSFGYTGALPQIARLAGMRWFFTQKLSWNRVNSLPHHTFWWEGIDGTKIWTHFPPVDCYDSIVSAEEVKRAEANFKEKGRAAHSLLPYGYGDGGGGPVPEMMERVRRFADMEDAPRLAPGGPAEFFAAARAEYPDPPTWTGELYLEFHRGVYTTQHALKQGNRRSESLLSVIEFLAALGPEVDYPADRLEALWRRLLLLQFHDILPGSSTAWVNRDAAEEFAALVTELETLLAHIARSSGGAGGVLNAASHARREVIEIGGRLSLVEVPELSVAGLSSAVREPTRAVEATWEGSSVVLNNGLVRARIAPDGTLSSVWDHAARRELLLPEGRGNLLTLHPDHPSCFDAWELEEQYRRQAMPLDAVDDLRIVQAGPLRARVEITRSFGDSRVVQGVALDAESTAVDFDLVVDWRERSRVLKVGFPLAVRAARATAEIQFGHIERPVAVNTSWDQARFETSGQRWLLLREPGYGVALANDSSYGHDVHPARTAPGASTVGVDAGLTLLRAPNAPDPAADLGSHTFAYSLTVGADVRAAHRAGIRLNLPLRPLDGAAEAGPLVRLGTPTKHRFVVIDAVKRAFDGSGDLIVRLHEAAGARSATTLTLGRDAASVQEVDLLEDPVAEPTQALPADGLASGAAVGLALRPFQILTLRFGRSR